MRNKKTKNILSSTPVSIKEMVRRISDEQLRKAFIEESKFIMCATPENVDEYLIQNGYDIVELEKTGRELLNRLKKI